MDAQSNNRLAAGLHREKLVAGKIFLNYRRSDGGSWTSLLSDSLSDHFGAEHVFLDIVNIPPGARLQPYLAAQVSDCAAMVVVIGPQWLKELHVRIGQTAPDHVLIEIEVALQRGKPIVPVLIGGATMPVSDDLPATIQELADISGITLNEENIDKGILELTVGFERIFTKLASENRLADSHVDARANGQPMLVATGNVHTKRSLRVNQAPLKG